MTDTEPVEMDADYHVEALDQLCRVCLRFYTDPHLVDRFTLAADFLSVYGVVADEEKDGVYPPNVCKPCGAALKQRTTGVLPVFREHGPACLVCEEFHSWTVQGQLPTHPSLLTLYPTEFSRCNPDTGKTSPVPRPTSPDPCPASPDPGLDDASAALEAMLDSGEPAALDSGKMITSDSPDATSDVTADTADSGDATVQDSPGAAESKTEEASVSKPDSTATPSPVTSDFTKSSSVTPDSSKSASRTPDSAKPASVNITPRDILSRKSVNIGIPSSTITMISSPSPDDDVTKNSDVITSTDVTTTATDVTEKASNTPEADKEHIIDDSQKTDNSGSVSVMESADPESLTSSTKLDSEKNTVEDSQASDKNIEVIDAQDSEKTLDKSGNNSQSAQPGSQKTDPDSQKANSDSQKAGPDSQKADPDSQKANSDSQKADPDSQKANSDSQKADPDSQKANSDSQKADADFGEDSSDKSSEKSAPGSGLISVDKALEILDMNIETSQNADPDKAVDGSADPDEAVDGSADPDLTVGGTLQEKRAQFMSVLDMSSRYAQKPRDVTPPRRDVSAGILADVTLDMQVDSVDDSSQEASPLRPAPEPMKKFPCPSCRSSFSRQEALSAHALAAHKVPCRTCRMRFSTRAELKNHLDTWHAPGAAPTDVMKTPVIKLEPVVTSGEENLYTCMCQATFTDLRDWTRHVRTCVRIKPDPDDPSAPSGEAGNQNDRSDDEDWSPGEDLDDEGKRIKKTKSKTNKLSAAAMQQLVAAKKSALVTKTTGTEKSVLLKKAEAATKSVAIAEAALKKALTKAKNQEAAKQSLKNAEEARKILEKKEAVLKKSEKKKGAGKKSLLDESKKKVAYKCGVCGKLFSERSECTKHANTCSQTRCSACQSIFPDSGQLESHRVACDGRDRCIRCRQTMPDAQVESLHLTASGEAVPESGEVQCPVCKATLDWRQLSRHLDTTHGGVVDVFACDLCDVEVDRHVLMEKHLLQHMQDRKWYACDICVPGVWTRDKRDFNLHLLNYHLTPSRYACNFCPKLKPQPGLRTKLQWQQHFSTHHHRCATCRRKVSDLPMPLVKHRPVCCVPLYSDKTCFETMAEGNSAVIPAYTGRRAEVRDETASTPSKPTGKSQPKAKSTPAQGGKSTTTTPAPAKSAQKGKVLNGAAPATKKKPTIRGDEFDDDDDIGFGDVAMEVDDDDDVVEYRPAGKDPVKKLLGKIQHLTPGKEGKKKETVRVVGSADSLPGSGNVWQELLTQLVAAFPVLRQALVNPKLTCPLCEAKFEDNVRLGVHALLHHASLLAERDVYQPYTSVEVSPPLSASGRLAGTWRCLSCHLTLRDVTLAYLVRHVAECGLCANCQHVFPTRELLHMHVRESTCGQGSRKHVLFPASSCYQCKQQMSLTELVEHYRTEACHLEDGRCKVCGLEVEEQARVQHAALHADLQPYCFTCSVFTPSLQVYVTQHLGGAQHSGKTSSCPVCSHTAASETELRKHLLQHHVCSHCGAQFDLQAALTGHRKQSTCLQVAGVVKHTDHLRDLLQLSDTRHQISRCRTCDASFLRRAHLLAHTWRQHPSLTECATCTHYSDHRLLLQRHQAALHDTTTPEPATQTGQVWHLCWSCDYRATAAHVLAAHVLSQHAHACRLCARAFRGVAELTAHVRAAHAGTSSRLQCSSCSCTFPSESAREEHARTHSSRTYSCCYCPDTFSDEASARAHAATTHHFDTRLAGGAAQPEPEEEPEGPVMCQHCGDVFDSADIASHERRCLLDVRLADIPCSSCQQTFQSAEALARHAKVHQTFMSRATQTNDVTIASRDVSADVKPGQAGRTSQVKASPGKAGQTKPASKPPAVVTSSSLMQKSAPSGGQGKKRPAPSPLRPTTGGKRGPSDYLKRSRTEEFDLSETSESDLSSDDIPYSEGEDDDVTSSGLGMTSQNVEYSCAVCEKDPLTPSRFPSLALLNQHMAVVHQSVPEFDTASRDVTKAKRDVTQATRLECGLCARTFSSQVTLATHRAKFHSGQNQGQKLECEVCNRTFGSAGALWKHSQQHD